MLVTVRSCVQGVRQRDRRLCYMRILLASASPRRSQLLDQIDVPHRVAPSAVDETRKAGESAEAYVGRLALSKAKAGWLLNRQDESVVLGADTVVVIDQAVLGKPDTPAAAEHMLSQLSGRTHRVLTAVALIQGTRSALNMSETEIRFRTITPEECRRYVATGESRDKAGAYAIQGRGAVFVAHLSGSYSGVMGLPLFETAALLKQFDVKTPYEVDNSRDGAA